MIKKSFCVLLAALTASLTALTGCSEKAADTSDSSSGRENAAQPSVEVETEAETEVEEEEDNFIGDGLPEKDFGGDTFSILTTTWYTAQKYIYADEMNGEVVNDALFRQRVKISDRFNVAVTCTANDDVPTVAATVDSLAASGDDSYSIVYNHDIKTMTNGLKGDFCDLRSFELLDFSKPWWQGTPQVFTIQGKLFAAANPMAVSGIYMNCTVSFNKALMTDLQMDLPYEKVRNGEWVFDDMISMAEKGMQDLDGNGIFDDKDQWGFLTSSYGWLQMQSDLGAGCMVKDDEGSAAFSGNIERMVAVMEKFDRMDEFTRASDSTDYKVDMFKEGRGGSFGKQGG